MSRYIEEKYTFTRRGSINEAIESPMSLERKDMEEDRSWISWLWANLMLEQVIPIGLIVT